MTTGTRRHRARRSGDQARLIVHRVGSDCLYKTEAYDQKKKLTMP